MMGIIKRLSYDQYDHIINSISDNDSIIDRVM